VTALALVHDDDYADEWADVAYTRISDDRTGEGASPVRQRREIKRAVADEGRTIPDDKWFEDLSKSAFRPGVVRDGFERLLLACEEHPVRRVWVLHDDRLIRDNDDTDLPRLIRVLAERKITIRCVEAADIKLWQAEGKMSARVRNAVNTYESERKKERVELATVDRARKGRFSGGVRRFGYTQRDTRIARRMDDDGTITEQVRPSGPLVLVPEEADAIASGYKAIASGKSLNSVVRDWRARGLTGVQGGPLTPQVVRQILLRAANAGLSTYKGEVVGKGDWPAIIDPATYVDVKALLEDPARRTTVGRPAVHLLSGIARCTTCGGALMASSKAKGEQGQEYRCRSGRVQPDPTDGTRQHVSRRRAKLDAAISEKLVEYFVANAGNLTRPTKPVNRNVAKAVADAASLRAKITAYQAQGADFEPADLAGLLRGLHAKLATAEAKIVADAGTPATLALVRSGDIPTAWAALDIAGKRTVIKENVSRIEVGPGKQGSRYATMHNVHAYDRDGKVIF
jgi:site-specific DNA recombinase